MSSKAHFSGNVSAIAMADESDDSLPNSCAVCGWGRTSDNKYMSPTLMEVNVTLIGSDKCHTKKSYCSEGDIGPAQVRIFM